MIIEPIEKNDANCELIMKWRNDVITREMSFNQNVKLWDEFKNEFYNNYFNNLIPPLFVTLENNKIGMISFIDNKEDNSLVININIAPENRGKKMGNKIIYSGIEYIKNKYNCKQNIIAHIKEKNIPSIKIFEKEGFKFQEKYIKNNETILKYKYIMNSIKIGNNIINNESQTYIIAELSANHNQNLENAKQLIKEAHKCGANAIKLQTYTPDTITLNCKKNYFKIKGTLWDDQYLYDLYNKAYTPWEWHKELKEEANNLGMDLFSSPFDTTAVDFLESLDFPAYKIASCEITDHILIKKIAQTRKPVIISSGMASKEELKEAIDLLRENGCNQICMLKCTSAYPAKPEDANLITMKDMAESFDVIPGLSDHTLGIEVPVTSVALGAKIIEKHFTLSRDSGSPDDAFSLNPNEFKLMVDSIRIAEKSIGKITYGGVKSEDECKKFRRSLFVCKNTKKGEIFTSENIRSVRPGNGLHTKFYENVLGKKANFDIEYGEPLNWKMVGNF